MPRIAFCPRSIPLLLLPGLLLILSAATPQPTSIDGEIVRIGTEPADSKPGILIVGAVDARKQYAKSLTDSVAERLQDLVRSDPGAFANVTYYVYSQPNPDAAARLSANPL